MQLHFALLFLCGVLGHVLAQGEDEDDMGRIFNGTVVNNIDNTKYSCFVTVLIINAANTDIESFCGGVIVNNLTIVTAASCLAGISRRPILLPGRVRVFFGSVIPTSLTDVVIKAVSNYSIHPDFVIHSNKFDIATVTLAASQSETALVKYVSMPTAKQIKLADPFAGMTGTVHGWGVHDKAGDVPIEPLNFIDMVILPTKKCFAKMKEIYYTLQTSSMCTDTVKATKGICKFDTGGPLIVTMPGSTNGPTLVGVASYFEDCGTKYPNIFTKVGDAAVLKWINSKGGPKPI